MGQCPCWGSRKKPSYNRFIYDEDYLEYGSSDKESFNTYRPPVPSSQQKPVNSNTSTISSSPYTVYSSSPNTSVLSQQPADSQLSSSPHSQEPSQISQDSHISQQQLPQFTQYTESVFLSRPNQPTDSMMVDSMMDSTILGLQRNVVDSGMIDSSMMMNNSAESSVYYDASSNSFIANSVHAGAFEPPSPPLHHQDTQQQQQ